MVILLTAGIRTNLLFPAERDLYLSVFLCGSARMNRLHSPLAVPREDSPNEKLCVSHAYGIHCVENYFVCHRHRRRVGVCEQRGEKVNDGIQRFSIDRSCSSSFVVIFRDNLWQIILDFAESPHGTVATVQHREAFLTFNPIPLLANVWNASDASDAASASSGVIAILGKTRIHCRDFS